MGIEPRIFGPSFWGAIHYAALGAPDLLDTHHQTIYLNFYTLLPEILPCSACGQHFGELLKEIPITPYLKTSTSLFEWTVITHNAVNKRLNKPEISVSEAKKIWMRIDNPINNKPPLDINYNDYNKKSKDEINNKNNLIILDIILKCFIILLVFGGGVYIGSVAFSNIIKARKK
jgi:hypothetical protein